MSAIALIDRDAASRGRWAVAAMFAVNGFIIGSWAPQIPLMLPRHSITEFTLGLLILAFGLGAVTAMVWTGRLINHYGSRTVTRTFAIIAAFGLAAIVLSPSIPLAAIALFLTGACGGSMDVAMNANAVEVEKRLDKAIMSASHGFWSLGGFIGGGIGGPLIVRLGAEGHAIFASAVSLIVVLIAMQYLISEPAHHEDDGPKPHYAWPKAPIVYILGLMALFSMVPEGAVLDWAALYLSKELGSSLSVSGLAFAFFAGTMAMMRFAGDSVRNRFGAVSTMRWSAFIAAGGMLAGGLAPNDWFAIIAFAIAGLGIANTVPIAFSAAGNLPGFSAGAAISVVTMMGYSGILIAPSAIGFVAEHIGFRITYIVLAGALVLVGLAAAYVSSADRAKAESPA
ncbi:MAG: MFS transporter [Rhizobiaceae bacterium]